MNDKKEKLEMFFKMLGSMMSERIKPRPTKPPTEFVKRQRELQARSKPRLLWDSQTQGTYRR